MHTLNYPLSTKWVVAHNGEDIYHTSIVEPQNCFATGQPYLEVFDSEEDLLTAFPQLSSNYTELTVPPTE